MGRRNRKFPLIWAVPAQIYVGKCWNHDPADVPAGSCPALPAALADRSRSSGGGLCQTPARCQRHFHHELKDAQGERCGAALADHERPCEMIMKVILAQPRGFCAGVVRAIEIVERALEKYGPPVYVRHEIVHNKFVVESLKNKGAIFVEDLSEVPPLAVTVFSAHGVARTVEEEAADRNLSVLNATCPLVTKVHNQGKRYMSKGRALILIGHAGHPEVEGTMGQVPGPVLLLQNVDNVAALTLPKETPVAYITQTTLSVDDTKDIIAALQQRFPDVQGPDIRDICYATQNRQSEVRDMSKLVDVILVVGANNSSNSNRLREIGTEVGVASYLIADGSDLNPEWLKDAKAVGITAGASAPEVLVDDVIEALRRIGPVAVSVLPGREENIEFRLPVELAAS